MSYKGFMDADSKVVPNTYGELTYTMRDIYGSKCLFKEEGMFDRSYKLTSGKRDISGL